jgi:hypothetical protein
MKTTTQFTLIALFAASLALPAFAQTSRFDDLANLPFPEGQPTKENYGDSALDEPRLRVVLRAGGIV